MNKGRMIKARRDLGKQQDKINVGKSILSCPALTFTDGYPHQRMLLCVNIEFLSDKK